jgi:hypothetical protein
LALFSRANPFTPFEIVFLFPADLPDRSMLMSVIELKRPHFLDIEERLLFNTPGNRAVVVTFVNRCRGPLFTEEMERRIFWMERFTSAHPWRPGGFNGTRWCFD